MHKLLRKIARINCGEESGFTLIELLIVIAILGILAAVIIPNVSSFTGSGHVVAANTELETIKTAVSAYQGDNDMALPCATQPSGSGTANAQPIVAADLAPYVNSGNIVGTYEVDDLGVVTGVTYPGLTWDTSNSNWSK